MAGELVQIVPSKELLVMRMKRVIGRQGLLVEWVPNKRGAYIKLFKPYQEEEEWYIPRESIQIVHE